MGTPYSPNFYDGIRDGIRSSADALVPLLSELLLDGIDDPRVIDVGGGEGWWARAFQDHGCDVLCVDGDYVEDPVVRFLSADLTRPLPFMPGSDLADLAVCLEVTEHLPPERAPSFVEELCQLAPVVVFSAAIPNQGGTDHLNEQWPGYWRDLFHEHGFHGTGALRQRIWDDERIAWWYRQNLLVFSKAPHLHLQPDPCHALVHPECFRVRARKFVGLANYG